MIRSRHGAYLDRWYREHEQHHNDGVNRLVVRFAREGVEVVAGWRGEVNVPGLTQVRPDLLVQVSEGALGGGTHCIEFERTAVSPQEVEYKLGPYQRMAAAGRALPLLMVCETARGRRNFRNAAGALPMLTATQETGFCRAGDRRGHGVEQGRGSGGAALPVGKGVRRCRPGGLRLRNPALRYPAAAASSWGKGMPKSGLYLALVFPVPCIGNCAKLAKNPTLVPPPILYNAVLAVPFLGRY